MIAAGIGCRERAEPDAILAAIRAALRQSGRNAADISLLATMISRSTCPALQVAAHSLGVALVAVSDIELQAASARCLTDSPLVRAATGLPSVAEAAALAAAGPGSRLIGPRVAAGSATCALAETVQ